MVVKEVAAGFTPYSSAELKAACRSQDNPSMSRKRGAKFSRRQDLHHVRSHGYRRRRHARPTAAHRQRGVVERQTEAFNAPETWHEPTDREDIRFVVEPAGTGYFHPVTIEEVRDRIEQLPSKYTEGIDVVQFSCMTKKRAVFPCYGMQWGPNIYLYPIEETLEESYVRPPLPNQLIEARMYGGVWTQHGTSWRLCWTERAIKDFYLNNVLIHEIGHINDHRNTTFTTRERYADWFAIEYGYRASRGRR